MTEYDLLVIGAGSGGVSASRRAAHFGAKVAICEGDQVGGTCVIRGCVPKKLLVYASHFSTEFEEAAGFGWSVGDSHFDWQKLIANKDKEINRLNGIYKSMLAKAGVELIEKKARFIDAHTVQLGERQVTAKKILIATGGWPVIPDIPGSELAITSNEAFHLDQLPKRIVVVGGGYIAVEFAGIFYGMGAQVTQLYRGEQILRGFDWDVRQHLAEQLLGKGVDLRVQTTVSRIEKTAQGLSVTLDNGACLETDQVMFATGRSPNIAGLGLENIGIETNENGAIKVDHYFRTNVKDVFALGDVTDHVNLTPVAINEGRAFAEVQFGNIARTIDYTHIPSAVFSQPSVAVCGLTEEQARQEYGEVLIFRSVFKPMKYSFSDRPERTMMKLIVDKHSDKILGAHMVGPDAAEIMQGIAIALKMGATKAQFDHTMGIHPSSAEEFVTMRESVSSQ